MALYNLKNPAVKRLMREAEELREPTEEYHAEPLDDNLFEWHFTLRGPPTTEFEGGIYHGRITLPPEYPMKPPSIILLTPNGRFEINKKICLSISGHHPETWQPSWSIRTALLALIGFFPTHGNGAIGSLDYTPEERKHLAVKSQNWKCPECGHIKDSLKNNAKLPNQNTEVSDVIKLLKEHNVTQPIPSDDIDLLREEESEQESRCISNINEMQLHGFESHTSLPQSANLVQSDASTISLPRNRYLTLDGNIDNSQSFKLNENEIVQLNEMKNASKKETNYFCNLFSLLVIWVIVVILGVLVARRLLYY